MNTTVTYTRLAEPNEPIAYRATVRAVLTEDDVRRLETYGIDPLKNYSDLDPANLPSVVQQLRDGVNFEFYSILDARERARNFTTALLELPRYWQTAESLLAGPQ